MAARRPVIVIIALILVALPALTLTRCNRSGATTGPVTIVIKGETFVLEVAADEATIIQGLMYRESIPAGTGMIFIMPDVQIRGYWMKNCLTDMDIIFLDARGYVTATHRMSEERPQGDDESLAAYEARLPRYTSAYAAQFAIELPPGSVEQLNVRFEDKIELDLEALKARIR